MQQWRRLAQMTSSLQLERLFRNQLEDSKDGTLIKDVQRWRSLGVDYKLFVSTLPTDAK